MIPVIGKARMASVAMNNSASIAVANRLGATLESSRIYRGFESGVFRRRSPADLKQNQTKH